MSPKLRQRLDTFAAVAQAARITPQTTWSDLQNGNTVYRRTLRGIIAVNLATGEPQWQYPIEPQLDASLAAERTSATAFARGAGTAQALNQFDSLEQTALANLFCMDNITGQIAGDAERLYMVTKTGKPVLTTSTSMMGLWGGSSNTAFHGSRLVALEKTTGRRVWSTGQSAFENRGTKSKGVWFVGIPAMEGNKLYSIVEWNAEIRLACFAHRTGERLWDTPLAWPEQSIDKDPYRQLWTATPLVKQGVVFCPTTAGWVTCVDQFTRSVLWASRSQTKKSAPIVPTRRGRPVVQTMPSSLRERWALPKVVSSADKLVLLPHEAHDILILDGVTGKQTKRIPIKSATVLLHIDETAITCCEESKMVCRSSVNGETRWTHNLSKEDGMPTGLAVRQNDNLLVPMSTGAIARIALATGNILDTTPNFLPHLPWGKLTRLNADGESTDLLYMAPDRILRLSANPTQDPSGSPVETAADLIDAGKWQDALSLAESVPKNDRAYKEANDICFQCRMQLAADHPKEHLPQLTKMAESPERRLRLQVLEIQILLNQQKLSDAAKRLAELLKLKPSQLLQPATELHNLNQGNTVKAVPVVERPLQTWAAATLTELLDKIPNPEVIVEQLDDVSDAVLVSVHHPRLLRIVQNRIPKASSHESSFQLLNHAINLKTHSSSAGTDFSREAELLLQIVSRIQKTPNAAERRAAMLLLNVAVLELPNNFSATTQLAGLFRDDAFRSGETIFQEYRQQLKQRFEKWSADSYRTIPIARLRSTGRIDKSLTFANSDDPFLTNFAWSATSGDYGRIRAQELWDNTDRYWSIPGNIQLHSTYTAQQDMLHRAGSILLLKSWTGLTAVSVLGRTVLWSRSFKYSPNSSSTTKDVNFERFDLQKTRLPSQRLPSSFHIVGSGRGWLALTNLDEFSMIDIISGNTLWSCNFDSENSNIVASGSTVVVMSSGKQIAAFNAKNGNSLSLQKNFDDACAPIRSVDNLFVCWRHSAGKNDQTLRWMEPQTCSTIAEIDLSTMQMFDFVDDDTLVGFNDRHQIQLVDLVKRTSETFSFGVDSETAKPEPAEEPNDVNLPPELPLWSAARINVAIDGLNVYIGNRKSSRSQPLRGPANRNMMLFTGDLRAIDRETGELNWQLKNDGHLMATTDDMNLPLLLMVAPPTPPAEGKTTSRFVFRGVSKLTGKQVFQQVIPSRALNPSYPELRTLSLTSPSINTIDVGVQGLSVRIEGRPVTPKEDSQR